ncbi:MAG TPA: WD40 repeat domain-containing protein [Methanocella sp.]|nr:WD40 repeat domain-containing protein [Methanocella sp.]
MPPEKILQAEWKRQASGKINHVYMTPNSSFITAASDDHDVYFIDHSGRLIWANTTGDDVVFVKSTDDGEYIVACSKDSIVSFYNKRGDQLWTYRLGKRLRSLDMDPSGALVVAGYDDCSLRALDRQGKVAWSRSFMKPVTTLSISTGGSLVTAGTDEGRSYTFTKDGRLRWEFITNSPVVYTDTSFDGEFSFVLEMMNNTIHCVSDRGYELASSTYAGRITDLSITDDGRYVAIGFSNSQVYYTDKNLQQIWKAIVPGPVERIKISGDGSMVFVTTGTGNVYVLNRKGDILLTYPFDSIALGLWSSADGNYFAIGAGNLVYMFSIGRYLQYSREQIKILKLKESSRQRPLYCGKNAGARPGAPDPEVNVCRRCGEPILLSRQFCNYCEMMMRRGR